MTDRRALFEEWRPIAGYEGLYEVSDQGRVKSLRRMQRLWHGGERELPERILVTCPNSWGYHMVTLHKGGKQRVHAVHVLVAEAFIGPRPGSGREVDLCHFDGDRGNNALTNLRYDSRAANAADRDRHGRTHRGEAHHFAKLTEEQARLIKNRGAAEDAVALAREYGVSEQTVRRICDGRAWRGL